MFINKLYTFFTLILAKNILLIMLNITSPLLNVFDAKFYPFLSILFCLRVLFFSS
jgi:hypothetical protein